MNNLGGYLKSISRPRFEEDYVDRLNYKVTSYVLLACAIAILAKEYGGEPIACWGRAEWPGGWLQYAHDICFVENTYYIPINETVPRHSAERERKEINYYQWVPFILALQAVFFNIPHVFWRTLNSTFGIDVRSVITMADSTKAKPKMADKNKIRDSIVTHLSDRFKNRDGILKARKESARSHEQGIGGSTTSVRMLWRWASKNFLGIVYILTKVLFLINLIGQWIFIGYFLGKSTHFWAYHTLGALTRGETWADTGHFPRVTICDFQIRQIVNIHRHSVQCVLMANMFNEKIFVGLWYWVALVLAITAWNTVNWKYWLIFSRSREEFLENLLIPARDTVFSKKKLDDKYKKPQEKLSDCAQTRFDFLMKAKKHAKVLANMEKQPILDAGWREALYVSTDLTEEEKASLDLEQGAREALDAEAVKDEKKMIKVIRLIQSHPAWSDAEKKNLVENVHTQSVDETEVVDQRQVEAFMREAHRLGVRFEPWQMLGIPYSDQNKMWLMGPERLLVEKHREEEKERIKVFAEYDLLVQNRKNYKKTVYACVEEFASYIGADGILVFRLMDKNAGSYITSAVASLVFKNFCNDKNVKFDGKGINGLPIDGPSSVRIHNSLMPNKDGRRY